MAEWVTFYEKPGCASNSRQKRLLQQAGVSLVIRNLLVEPWTASRLALFFEQLPVSQWFNPASPRIKSGEVIPESYSPGEALVAMMADPLLIRRPLIEARGFRTAGFDWTLLSSRLGLDPDLLETPANSAQNGRVEKNSHTDQNSKLDQHSNLERYSNLEKCSHPEPGHRCSQEG